MTPETKAIVALLRKRAKEYDNQHRRSDILRDSNLSVGRMLGARDALRDAAREIVRRWGKG